jgi:4-amino-4-deoxy-L-arabinose transferase-like glycosyltransferase
VREYVASCLLKTANLNEFFTDTSILHMMSGQRLNRVAGFLYSYRYQLFLLLIATVTLINLRIDIMEVDAAQYASISMEMGQTDRYIQVYHRGADYLDKPPLLFWLSSLTISLLGNTSFAYKLPAIILLWLGVWATYRFGKLWYDKQTGMGAALILAASSGFYLMTNDVRTDGLLTAFVILSVYLLSEYLKKGNILPLLLGGLCIGAAMLAKGPLGLVIPFAAIGMHLIVRGEWKKIFDVRWLLVLLCIGIVLAPMLYGLYSQFDLHPEKEVYRLKGPSGIGFFFWTQSFGRITGENYWHNDTSILYFPGTILWDFQPWIILFAIALVLKFNHLWIHIFRKQTTPRDETKVANPIQADQEWISLFGFAIPFIALSFSGYKLPHYIFPLFPFAAIMLASFLVKKGPHLPGWSRLLHYLILHAFIAIVLIAMIWVFPVRSLLIPLIALLLYGLFWWWMMRGTDVWDRWLFPSLCIALIFQFVFSLHFYPELLKYQSTSQAGKMIEAQNPRDVFWYRKHGHALDFYSGRIIPELSPSDRQALAPGSWVFTTGEGLKELDVRGIVNIFDDYPVTLLNKKFLNPATRESVLEKKYLVELK